MTLRLSTFFNMSFKKETVKHFMSDVMNIKTIFIRFTAN